MIRKVCRVECDRCKRRLKIDSGDVFDSSEEAFAAIRKAGWRLDVTSCTPSLICPICEARAAGMTNAEIFGI